MALFEQFPYTNFHEMNMDWLLQLTRANSRECGKLSKIYDAYNIAEVVFVDDGNGTLTTDSDIEDIVANYNDGKKILCTYVNGNKVLSGIDYLHGVQAGNDYFYFYLPSEMLYDDQNNSIQVNIRTIRFRKIVGGQNILLTSTTHDIQL